MFLLASYQHHYSNENETQEIFLIHLAVESEIALTFFLFLHHKAFFCCWDVRKKSFSGWVCVCICRRTYSREGVIKLIMPSHSHVLYFVLIYFSGLRINMWECLQQNLRVKITQERIFENLFMVAKFRLNLFYIFCISGRYSHWLFVVKKHF